MSRKKRSAPLEQPPAEIIRGAEIIAEYLAQEVSVFCGNPLNEALPPTLTPHEVTEYLLQLPAYSDADREKSQVARVEMTETAREFFVPNGKHLMVYYAITNMIRRGYVRRNPVLWEYWKQVHSNIKSFQEAIKKKPFPNSRARGLAIVGRGGTGKSTTVEKVLQSLPQVITHVSYKGQDFIMKQLVWLKLDCPRNGSLRELCVNFFPAVDEILGTNYEKRYAGVGGSYRTLEALIAGMARVAANQCLGILVIDEIQDLSEARSGGDITMVNFFVHMENAIGVPFALIGTQDAMPILSKQFRQARRVSEQGYILWDRMSEVEPDIEESDDDDDDEDAAAADIPPAPPAYQMEEDEKEKAPRPDPVWKNFVETLWTYQYVKHPTELKTNVVKDKCAHTLYNVSKGVPAVAQTVFVLTQQLAILTGEEKITPRLIRETVKLYQQVIEEMLGEARMKKPREIKPVSDLDDLEQIYEADDPLARLSAAVGGNGSVKDLLPAASGGVGTAVEARPKQKEAATTPKETPGLRSSGNKNDKAGKKTASGRSGFSKDDLRTRAAQPGKRTKSSGTQKRDKYSKSPDEYLNEK